VEKGHRVTVVVPAPHHMSGKVSDFGRIALRRKYSVDGVQVIKTYAYPNFRAGYFRRVLYYLSTPLFVLLACVRQKPDVILGSSPPFFLAPGAFLLSKIRRVPFVLEVRDAWLEFAFAKGLVPKFLVKALRFQQEMNGYEEDVFAQADPSKIREIRQAWGLEGKLVAIYAGTLGLARDCLVFVRAAARLQSHPDILFAFVGEGERKDEMLQFVRDRQLKNCQFVPMQPRRDMPAWFAACSVGLNSIRAGEALESSLSNKIFDYLGSGLPVVFAGNGDTKHFLEQSGGGIVVPAEDDGAMAEAILRLYRHPDLRHEMGGREYVLSQYSRRKLREPLGEMLDHLPSLRSRG